jgi:hypothetical protein
MPAFPRNLKEIKIRRAKERRPKPLVKNDPIADYLGPKFKQANIGAVKHAHHEDLLEDDSVPSPAKKAFQKLTPRKKQDLINGLDALGEIFKWIMGETSRLLDNINQGLAAFNEANAKAKGAAAARKYTAATKAFNKFVNDLNNPKGTSFGATINAANIEPIQDGGYYTSARVVIAWLGGTHSGSSLIHVP